MNPTFRLSSRASLLFAALLSTAPLGLSGAAMADDPAPAAATPSELAKALVGQLKHLHMADGLVAEEVALFPLYVLTEPAPLDMTPLVTGTPFRAAEMEGRTALDQVRVLNPGPKPALLLGGTVLEGGRRDRIVIHDVIIPSADARDVAVNVASMSSDTRKTPVDFKLYDFLAPPFVRDTVLFTNSKSAVPKFVSHFLDFRNPGDKRKSLSAIGDADALADYCLVCQRSMAEWPEKKGAGTVVGGISVVRGRVQAIELFATNQHLEAFFSPVLKSLSFPAAAIALRAKKLNMQLPRTNEAHLAQGAEAAKDLMAHLTEATFEAEKMPEDAVGVRFVVKLKDGTRGTALALDGRLVHLAMFPSDSFDRALYSQPLEPLEPEDVTDDGDARTTLAELARRTEAGGRLTESEKTLLDRLKRREELGTPGPKK